MHQHFPKTLVLGIDGLSLALARQMADKGIFTNLAPIIGSAHTHAVSSELPDVSPVNWASFFTGRGPEEHGVYGFTQVNPATYQMHLVDLNSVQASTVWDWFGNRGMLSKLINLPCTYPAPSLKGMMISGFVALDLEQAVFPRPLLPMLERIDYRLEADTVRGLTRPDLLLKDLRETVCSRVRAFDLFWPDLAWSLFVIVFTELDRMSHFLQDAILDERHRLHRNCMTVLKDIDRAAGHVLERFNDLAGPKRLLVVADHGFTALESEVDVNTFLRNEGYLSLGRNPFNELDMGCMDLTSKAFALDPGRIYIHSRSRFSRGCVNKVEYAGIRERIRQNLLQLEYQGRKVMDSVYYGEEIYPSGIGLPPDLLCVPSKGFDLKAKFDRRDVFGHYSRTGTHCPDDVFFYDSAGTRPEKIRHILPGAGIMGAADHKQ
ncbi:alkaline phosphatase family protein [Desulfonatronovibrio hydrogenovorans]|uniref:alkaline phosphatase family protein n=1 Tax=Desulfonatronovibrio hydrogenovorans TaxID=53245 RepID=UPI00054FE9C8|nr:alkaline phosphatase family protein [Desulfonatronovibrio hydrogenovorans]